MNDAPERMCYANCGLVGEACACYRAMMSRNHAAAPVVAVKPLVWKGTDDFKYSTNEFGQYQIREAEDGFYVQFDGSRSVVIASKLQSVEEGISPAQAHYRFNILSALNTTPASPLADPRVVALVDALKGEEDRGYCLSPEARAALAALSEPAPDPNPQEPSHDH